MFERITLSDRFRVELRHSSPSLANGGYRAIGWHPSGVGHRSIHRHHLGVTIHLDVMGTADAKNLVFRSELDRHVNDRVKPNRPKHRGLFGWPNVGYSQGYLTQ